MNFILKSMKSPKNLCLKWIVLESFISCNCNPFEPSNILRTFRSSWERCELCKSSFPVWWLDQCRICDVKDRWRIWYKSDKISTLSTNLFNFLLDFFNIKNDIASSQFRQSPYYTLHSWKYSPMKFLSWVKKAVSSH